MKLDRRIALLEHRRAASGPVTRCPACDHALGGSEPMRGVTFRTEFGQMGQRSDADRCSECGCTLVYRVEFDRQG